MLFSRIDANGPGPLGFPARGSGGWAVYASGFVRWPRSKAGSPAKLSLVAQNKRFWLQEASNDHTPGTFSPGCRREDCYPLLLHRSTRSNDQVFRLATENSLDGEAPIAKSRLIFDTHTYWALAEYTGAYQPSNIYSDHLCLDHWDKLPAYPLQHTCVETVTRADAMGPVVDADADEP